MQERKIRKIIVSGILLLVDLFISVFIIVSGIEGLEIPLVLLGLECGFELKEFVNIFTEEKKPIKKETK